MSPDSYLHIMISAGVPTCASCSCIGELCMKTREINNTPNITVVISVIFLKEILKRFIES